MWPGFSCFRDCLSLNFIHSLPPLLQACGRFMWPRSKACLHGNTSLNEPTPLWYSLLKVLEPYLDHPWSWMDRMLYFHPHLDSCLFSTCSTEGGEV